MTDESKTIATQNDRFRESFYGGKVLLTQGISALSFDDQQIILSKVKHFNQFTSDNDPYGQHDFGSIKFKGLDIFWKIDLYDLNYEFYSPEPSDLNQTNRVLTIMLAEEY